MKKDIRVLYYELPRKLYNITNDAHFNPCKKSYNKIINFMRKNKKYIIYQLIHSDDPNILSYYVDSIINIEAILEFNFDKVRYEDEVYRNLLNYYLTELNYYYYSYNDFDFCEIEESTNYNGRLKNGKN